MAQPASTDPGGHPGDGQSKQGLTMRAVTEERIRSGPLNMQRGSSCHVIFSSKDKYSKSF